MTISLRQGSGPSALERPGDEEYFPESARRGSSGGGPGFGAVRRKSRTPGLPPAGPGGARGRGRKRGSGGAAGRGSAAAAAQQQRWHALSSIAGSAGEQQQPLPPALAGVANTGFQPPPPDAAVSGAEMPPLPLLLATAPQLLQQQLAAAAAAAAAAAVAAQQEALQQHAPAAAAAQAEPPHAGADVAQAPPASGTQPQQQQQLKGQASLNSADSCPPGVSPFSMAPPAKDSSDESDTESDDRAAKQVMRSSSISFASFAMSQHASWACCYCIQHPQLSCVRSGYVFPVRMKHCCIHIVS